MAYGTCQRCNGRGEVPYTVIRDNGDVEKKEETCPDCNGSGEIKW